MAALAIGALIVLVMNAHRIGVAPFLNDFRALYGVEYAGVGGLLTAYLLGYAFAQIPAGLAADNLPTKRVILAGLVTIGVASIVFAVTTSYPVALAARFVMGVSSSTLFSPVIKVAVGLGISRGLAVGVLESGAALGMLIGLSGLPAASELVGVVTVFVALGIATLIVFALALVALPYRRLPPQARQPLATQVREVTSTAFFWRLLAADFLILLSTYAVISWLPTYLVNELGYSKPQAGALTALANVMMLVVAPLGGRATDLLGQRGPLIAVGAACNVVSYGLLLAFRDPGAAVAATIVAGIGLGLSIPLLNAVAAEGFGHDRAGTSLGLMNTGGQIASASSGVVYGSIVDRSGFDAVWLVGLGVAVAGGAVALALGDRSARLVAHSPTLDRKSSV